MDETRRELFYHWKNQRARILKMILSLDTIDYKIELRNLKEEAKDEDEESGISEDETSLSSGVVSGP